MGKISVACPTKKNGRDGSVCFILKCIILLFFLLHALTPLAVYSQETSTTNPLQKIKDSAEHSLVLSGNILLTNIGFAPLPAFSFDKPIGIAFLCIKKRKFSYEPAFSIGLNGKPWMMDNWFRYIFINKKTLTLSSAINPSPSSGWCPTCQF